MTSHLQKLEAFGWVRFFEEHFQCYAAEGHSAARVMLQNKHHYRIYTEWGEASAEISGKLRHESAGQDALPAVGDWVVIRRPSGNNKATILAVLPRKSKFTRKEAGSRTQGQVIGTNIDTVFLVTSLNQDFSPRRVERYLLLAWASGAAPVIILSKSDICDDVDARLAEIHAVAAGVPIHAISVVTGEGLDVLWNYLGEGETVALLGSSGVGKSTLINHLIGRHVQRVQEVREQDGRGRHTTTHRELILLPQGGLVLDTPGMRELQLWDAEDGLHLIFDDIETRARMCNFSDCRHQDEPRCAIRAALAEGTIDPERYESYEKLKKEIKYLERKRDVRAQISEKNKWKKLSRLASERGEMKRR